MEDNTIFEEPVTYVEEPHAHDILITENGEKVYANHGGNVYFLKLLVSDYKEWTKNQGNRNSYQDVNLFVTDEENFPPAEDEATASARRVVQKIQSRNPPGRFLKQALGEELPEEENFENSKQHRSDKSRWQIMTEQEAISTAKVYHFKVRGELEKRGKKKRKDREQHFEQDGEHYATRRDSKHARTDQASDYSETSHFSEGKSTKSQVHSKKGRIHQKVCEDGGAIDEPHPHDCLLGSEGTSNAGNKVFCDILNKYKAEFQTVLAPSPTKEQIKVARRQYAALIMDEFKLFFIPSGRFLQQNGYESLWVELEDEKVLQRISNSLIFTKGGAPQQESSSSKLLPSPSQTPISTTNTEGSTITPKTPREAAIEVTTLEKFVNYQIHQLEMQNFQAQCIKKQYGTLESNSNHQIQLLIGYKTQIHQLRREFQQQQNEGYLRQVLQQLKLRCQTQMQQQQARHQMELLQQQQVQEEELTQLRKKQETELQQLLRQQQQEAQSAESALPNLSRGQEPLDIEQQQLQIKQQIAALQQQLQQTEQQKHMHPSPRQLPMAPSLLQHPSTPQSPTKMGTGSETPKNRFAPVDASENPLLARLSPGTPHSGGKPKKKKRKYKPRAKRKKNSGADIPEKTKNTIQDSSIDNQENEPEINQEKTPEPTIEKETPEIPEEELDMPTLDEPSVGDDNEDGEPQNEALVF